MVTATDASSPPKLLDQVVARLRVKHYSLRTEKTYVDWIKRYIWFHGKRLRHPKDCGPGVLSGAHKGVERALMFRSNTPAPLT